VRWTERKTYEKVHDVVVVNRRIMEEMMIRYSRRLYQLIAGEGILQTVTEECW
jgi:hypothetical protein